MHSQHDIVAFSNKIAEDIQLNVKNSHLAVDILKNMAYTTSERED